MFEIAGGILIVILILCFLPWILATSIVLFGSFVLLFLFIVAFYLAGYVGMIVLVALIIFIVFSD